jgi:enoyl-[acyl-carrier protein] reductase/trans-2-enoyl-CoA reductase (NAD+)
MIDAIDSIGTRIHHPGRKVICMIIKPKVRGFVCVTAHPTGCEANVREQIDYVNAQGPIPNGPKRVLVVGASTGYGLASRITAAFGCGAATAGVFLEREPTEKRPATAGWYNSVAFEKFARAQGLYAASLNGDAFSDELKSRTIDEIASGMGGVDLVVYSLASPVRTHPRSGEKHRSVLKPLAHVYEGKTLDTDRNLVNDIRIEPADEREAFETVSVMGGEDWEWWIDALDGAGLLADGCRTVAFTYIGPNLTWPIYWEGTIGKAKEDLDRAAGVIGARLGPGGGWAGVAVMKGLVTQASSAIPVVPLYISLLYKIMKEQGIHEGGIEQIQRLFASRLYSGEVPVVDADGRIRMDDWEMRDDVQAAIDEAWPQITTDNLDDLTDYEGYKAEFLKLFGFGLPGVDYDADVDPVVSF